MVITSIALRLLAGTSAIVTAHEAAPGTSRLWNATAYAICAP